MRKVKSVNLTMCLCLKRAYSALSLFIQMSCYFSSAVDSGVPLLWCDLGFFTLLGSFLKLVINIFGGRILQSNPIHYLPFYKRLRNLIHCSTDFLRQLAMAQDVFFFLPTFPELVTRTRYTDEPKLAPSVDRNYCTVAVLFAYICIHTQKQIVFLLFCNHCPVKMFHAYVYNSVRLVNQRITDKLIKVSIDETWFHRWW